jgi:hypothetical protein
MFRNGAYKHGYAVRPGTRTIEDFQQVISSSFQPEATFLNSLLITKFISGRFCILHNLEYTESSGTGKSIHQSLQVKELTKKVEEKFKIPESITSQVIADLDFSRDAWS